MQWSKLRRLWQVLCVRQAGLESAGEAEQDEQAAVEFLRGSWPRAIRGRKLPRCMP